MSKMSELSRALDELTACGEGLIRTANAIREMFTAEPDEQPKSVPNAEPQSEEPKTYSFADVRKAFSAKSHAGYTNQIKALITSYGADKLSAIKEEDYPRLMADLEAIA